VKGLRARRGIRPQAGDTARSATGDARKYFLLLIIIAVFLGCGGGKADVAAIKSMVFEFEGGDDSSASNYSFTIPERDFSKVLNTIAYSKKHKEFMPTDTSTLLPYDSARLVIAFRDGSLTEYAYVDYNVVHDPKTNEYMESSGFSRLFMTYTGKLLKKKHNE